MKNHSGFCSVNPSVNPDPIFTVENLDLVFDIGFGFTGQIPFLEPDPDLKNKSGSGSVVEIISKTGSGFTGIYLVNPDPIFTIVHPDPVLLQDLVPKKKARRLGGVRDGLWTGPV